MIKNRMTAYVTAAVTAMLLTSGCSSSGGEAPVTVTRTVTKAGAAAAPASGASSADGGEATAPASSAAAGANPDACSLLTLAEAQKVAGTKLMKPEGAGSSGGAATQCLFTGPTSGPTAQVEIYVGDGAKQQLTIDRDNLGHKFSTVAGIGDECHQEDNFIFVRKGSLWASLRLVRLNDAKDNVVPLQTGMKQIAARLP